jgi:hypothetical protein
VSVAKPVIFVSSGELRIPKHTTTHTDCHVRVRNCTRSRDVCYASQTSAIPRGTRGTVDRRRNWRPHRNCAPAAGNLALSVDQTAYRHIGNVSCDPSDVGQQLTHRLKDYAAVPLAGLGDCRRRCYDDWNLPRLFGGRPGVWGDSARAGARDAIGRRHVLGRADSSRAGRDATVGRTSSVRPIDSAAVGARLRRYTQ